MVVSPFEKEAFTYYALAVTVVLVRIYARTRMLGWNPKRWQGDDFFILLYLTFFTCALVCLHIIGKTGTNSNLTDDKTALMDQATIDGISHGSFADFCGWLSYTSAIWCLKACLLYMYARMTLGLQHQQRMLTYIIGFVVVAYVALELTIIFHCTPVQKQWQVKPYPGDACTLGVPNVIMLGVTNISTDMMLLLIPIPILWKVRLPIKKKLLLALLLCSGVFVILATTLRVVFTLKSIRVKNESAIWAIRETFVATITVNTPLIKPLFSTTKWFKSISSSSGSRGAKKSTGYSGGASHIKESHALSDFHRSQTNRTFADDIESQGSKIDIDFKEPASKNRESYIRSHSPRRYSYENREELEPESPETTAAKRQGGLRINMTKTCEVESINGDASQMEEGCSGNFSMIEKAGDVRKEGWQDIARPAPVTGGVGNIVRIERSS